MWLKFQRVSVLLFIAAPQLKRMKGLTIEVCGLQPWSLLIAFPVGSQGKGELPSCPSGSRNLITFHTMHKNTSTKKPPPPPSLPCLFSAVLLKPCPSFLCPLHFPFLSPPLLHCPSLLEICPSTDWSQFLFWPLVHPAFPVEALEAGSLLN